MLSFTRGRPIALITGGKYNNKIIHLHDENDKCCKKCSGGCIGKCCGKCCKGGNPDIMSDLYDVLDEDTIRKHKKKMSVTELNKLKKGLKLNRAPLEEDLEKIYNITKEKYNDKCKKEFEIPDDGVINPLPNYEKSERLYIAGPTDSGKSYYVSKLLKQFIKIFPNKKIWLLSDVDNDETLDSIKNVVRIKLDEELIDNPIAPEELSDSIVVFDDIDSIQNPKLYKSIQALRDSLLRRGRHENISVISTSHLLTNYKETRIILNEVNAVTFFPKSGSSSAIQYLLTKYCGLDKKQIKKIFELPSRWCTVYKNYPCYVMYEKGVYLL